MIITFLSAFEIYYTNGCPYHSGSPADGLSCASCHIGGTNTPSVTISSIPSFGVGNTYVPGTTYTISVMGQGYSLFGFDLEILDSPSNISNSVFDFGTITSISPDETVNTPSMGMGYTYSDIMHTAPKSSPFTFEWTAPSNGIGYLYCALLGINNNGSTSGDKSCVTSMTLNPISSTDINELKDDLNALDISIYPNPCFDFLNITYKVEAAKTVDIELLNFSGIKLLDIYHGENINGQQNIQYPISQYISKGTYTLKINIDNHFLTRKVIFK
jgi:hypothetical protein